MAGSDAPSPAGTPAGTPDEVAAAGRILDAAYERLDTAAALAVRQLREAAELAPGSPSWISRALGQGKEFLGGLTSFVGELVDTVKTFLDDPGTWIRSTWDGVYALVAVWRFDQFTASWKGFGKAFVAWDDWADNPARALGKVAFNVGSIVVGGGAVRQVVHHGLEDVGATAAVRQLLGHHPHAGRVVERLLADTSHRLNLTRDLRNAARRERTLALLDEMAHGRLLEGTTLEEFMKRHPGRGSLFEPVARDINLDAAGRSRKQVFVDAAKAEDPARAVRVGAGAEEQALVDGYAERLISSVEPRVADELRDVVETWSGDPDSVSLSSRTKSGSGILDKVERMTTGAGGRAPRPDYAVGDVIDAVGARITVEDTGQLGSLLEHIKRHYGTGDGGRILEVENLYASPKATSPTYRVVPMIIRADVDGHAYTFELQLTTRRASAAADLMHNTLYKPIVDVSAKEADAIRRMTEEAVALEHVESRGMP